jgi:hypothetical protein
VAVSLFSLREVFGRLPVLLLAKLFFAGNALAPSEKSANVAGKWGADPYGEGGCDTLRPSAS